MLITLTATCLRSLLEPAKDGARPLTLLDLPSYARHELGLHGLNLGTAMLIGLDRDRLEALRERADKAGCACLVLIESEPQPVGDQSEDVGAGAVDRLLRVLQASNVLGCSAMAVTPSGEDKPEVLVRAAERLRRVVDRAEKLEMNVLIRPGEGLTSTPERATELLKKVGGFRVGTLPDFQTAAATSDPVAYLRRLTPYASLVSASTVRITAQAPERGRSRKAAEPAGPGSVAEQLRHEPFDLAPLVKAVVSVGYDGTIAVDYRGGGDARLGVIRSRRLLERLLGQEPADQEE